MHTCVFLWYVDWYLICPFFTPATGGIEYNLPFHGSVDVHTKKPCWEVHRQYCCLHRWPRNCNIGRPDCTTQTPKQPGIVRAQKPHHETTARRYLGGGGSNSPAHFCSILSEFIQIKTFAAVIQMWLIKTKRRFLQVCTHKILLVCWCRAQITYISLLCISSMRSVKRTSLFLSQNPSAS